MNPQLNSKTGMVVISLILIIACLVGVWFVLPSVRLALLDRITGNTPEARIKAYVQAVLRDNEEAALAAWELPSWELPNGRSTALAKRRQAVTRELIAADLQDDFMVHRPEWWRTCCEAGVTCDSLNAGGARISVQFLDQQELPVTYIFDVFHRDGSYWGAAAGYPPRHWVLRDVYARGQEPLFWRLVYEPNVRHLDWPPAPEPPEVSTP